MVLGAALLLSLCACGGNDGQKAMAGAVAKAAQEALTDVDSLYSDNFLVFTPGENKTTYVMMGLYYMKDGQTQDDTALGLFDGDNMTDFALKTLNPEDYDALVDAMPKDNTEEIAKSGLIEEVCKDSGIGTYDQAKKDLGVS